MTRSVWDFRSFSPDAAGRFRLGRSFGSVVLGGLGLWLLFGLATAEARGGEFIVTPRGYEDQGGTGGAVGFSDVETARYQQVISAQEFSSVTSPLLISSLALRVDMRSRGGFNGYITNDFRLSTTLKAPDALSSVFAENIGLDETLVLPVGTGTLFFGGGGGGPTPAPFITHLRFAQSFFYDPRAGNLLLDMRSYGAHYVEMQGIQGLDYVGLPGDGVSSLQSRDVFSPIGTKFTGGYIIQFEYTSVPEPGSLGWLAGACGLTGAILRHRRRGQRRRQGGQQHVAT